MTSLLSSVVAVGSANIALAQAAPGTPLPGTPGFAMIFDENGHATINGQPGLTGAYRSVSDRPAAKGIEKSLNCLSPGN